LYIYFVYSGAFVLLMVHLIYFSLSLHGLSFLLHLQTPPPTSSSHPAHLKMSLNWSDYQTEYEEYYDQPTPTDFLSVGVAMLLASE